VRKKGINGRLIRITCQSCDHYQSAIPPFPKRLPYPYYACRKGLDRLDLAGIFSEMAKEKNPTEGAQKERDRGI